MNKRGLNSAKINSTLFIMDVGNCTINDSSTGTYLSNEGDYSSCGSDGI